MPSERRYASGPVVTTTASSSESPTCPASHFRWRTSSLPMSRPSLNSMARTRPSSRSMIRSTSCSPRSSVGERPGPPTPGRRHEATGCRGTRTGRRAGSHPGESVDRSLLRRGVHRHRARGVARRAPDRRAGASGDSKDAGCDFEWASTPAPGQRSKVARARHRMAEWWSWPASRPRHPSLRLGSSRRTQWWTRPPRMRTSSDAAQADSGSGVPARGSRGRRYGRGSRRAVLVAAGRKDRAGRGSRTAGSPGRSRQPSTPCARRPARLPASNSRRLTVGCSRPRSDRANGRIWTLTIRPAPEWVSTPAGDVEPVRMKRPGSAPASTARRTRSQHSGRYCHSWSTSPEPRRPGAPTPRRMEYARSRRGHRGLDSNEQRTAPHPDPAQPSSAMPSPTRSWRMLPKVPAPIHSTPTTLSTWPERFRSEPVRNSTSPAGTKSYGRPPESRALG